jgi:iron(III) transport system permease protein
VLAIIFCAALTALGTLIPLVWLAKDAVFAPPSALVELGAPLLNSLILAGCGAAATLALAIIVAAVERRGGPIARAASLAAGAGYAAPGAVIALGVLALYGFWARMGWLTGMGTALALGLLVWSYAARFTATAAQPVGAGFAKITTGIVGAARTMGAGSSRRLFEIDLPLAAPSVLAAALIVFIETLKELPATVLLRPIGFETLAVRAYLYASDERLAQAAAPALMLTIAGLIPILLLSHQMTRAWTHQR